MFVRKSIQPLFATALAAAITLTPLPSPAEPSSAGRADVPAAEREALVREALRTHPALRAADARARVAEERAGAEGSLPPPELMVDLWQVPAARPYALGDAGMLMIGLRQGFPAPGSLGAAERAALSGAKLERRQGAVALEQIAREVRHAFVDYLSSSARLRAHAEHRAQAGRVVEAARARLSAGAPLSDVTRAALEVEMSEASRAGDEARRDAARFRLNVLVGRPHDAPLGEPRDEGPRTVALDLQRLLELARQRRPELALVRQKTQVLAAESEGKEREATLPSFSVAGLYFAPVGPMDEHGIGASFSASLPWLWGAAGGRRDAAARAVTASHFEADEIRRAVETQVADAKAALLAAEARLRALDERLVPAARRQLEAELDGYIAGRSNLIALVQMEQAVTMAELDVIDARAELDHARAELEWATGGTLPTRPISRPAPAAKESPHVH